MRIGNLMLPLLISMLLGAAAATTAPSPAVRGAAGGGALELQNDWVRVWRSKLAPHQKTPIAEHLPLVTVYLTDAHLRITGANGRQEDVVQAAGTVTYRGGAGYAEENLSDRPLEAIVVELKPDATRSPRITLDPVVLDPQYHTVPFENDRVRVLRTVLAPHVKSPLHEHPHYVVVYLTELHTTMELGDGRVVDNPRRAGEVAWRDAMKHATENIGEQTAVEIQVEVK
jgi:quercetin dioxygenase-like cupin family protein